MKLINPNFSELADMWFFQNKGQMKESTIKKNEKLLAKANDALADLPALDIEPSDLLELYNELADTPMTARRIVQKSVAVLDWAVLAGHLPYHKVGTVLKQLNVPQYQSLNSVAIEELPAFFADIKKNTTVIEEGMMAFWLLVYTNTSRNEVAKAKKDEFDLKNKVWVLPAVRSRHHQEATIPLSAQALKIVKKLMKSDGEYLFPSPIENKKHISTWLINQVLLQSNWAGKQTLAGFKKQFKQVMFAEEAWSETAILANAGYGVDEERKTPKVWQERIDMMQHWADMVDGWRKGL